jgi:hypothetical protein
MKRRIFTLLFAEALWIKRRQVQLGAAVAHELRRGLAHCRAPQNAPTVSASRHQHPLLQPPHCRQRVQKARPQTHLLDWLVPDKLVFANNFGKML